MSNYSKNKKEFEDEFAVDLFSFLSVIGYVQAYNDDKDEIF